MSFWHQTKKEAKTTRYEQRFDNIQKGISQLYFLKAAYLVLVMSVFLSDIKVGQIVTDRLRWGQITVRIKYF